MLKITKDIALVLIPNPRSNQRLVLEPNIIPMGTSCGSLGFPLSGVDNQGRYRLDLRFQGAFISSFNKNVQVYEIDHLMYSGSSGCPIFIVDGTVFAMQDKSITGQSSPVAPPPPQSRQQRRQQMRQMQKQQAKNKQPHEADRLAISICIPSPDILNFARTNGVPV